MAIALRLPLEAPIAQEQPPALRLYQAEAVEAVASRLLSGEVQRGLVALPTGSGKTRVAAEVAASMSGRVLMVAHREELVRQNAEAMQAVNPGRSVGVVQAGLDECGADIVSASVQTLASTRRLERLGAVGLVIVDEAHHALARSYIGLLTDLGCLEDDERCVPALGLTATPERTDKLSLRQVWQTVLYRRSIREISEAGWLAPLRVKRVVLARLDLASVRVRQGDFAAGELGDALAAAGAPGLIVRSWQQMCSDRRSTVVFVPTVALAHEMAAAFRTGGVEAAAIHGDNTPEERRDLLDRFRAGRVRVLANAMLLTEGTDIPEIDCIVWARPSRSRPLIIQAIGRGCRLAPGKQDCMVLDVTGRVRGSLRRPPVAVGDLDGVEELPDREASLAAVRAGDLTAMTEASRMAWEHALAEAARARWLRSEDKANLCRFGTPLRLVAVEGPRDGKFGSELVYTAEYGDGEQLMRFSLAANRHRVEQAEALRESLFGLPEEEIEVRLTLGQAVSARTGRTYYELTPMEDGE